MLMPPMQRRARTLRAANAQDQRAVERVTRARRGKGDALRVATLLHQLCHFLQALVRLPRELARRAHDDADGALALDKRHALLLLEREHEERDREGERLARAREGDADHVAAREAARGVQVCVSEWARRRRGKRGDAHDGQTLKLDGRWRLDLLLLEVVEERPRQLHVL